MPRDPVDPSAPVPGLARRLLISLALALAALAIWGLGAWALRVFSLPAAGAEAPGLLAQRHDDPRLATPPGPPHLEPRTRISDATDPDFRGVNFSLRLVGRLWITRPGPYELGVESDDDSRLYLDGVKVVDNSGEHGPRLRSARLWLAPGPHLIEVEYAQRGGGALLNLVWAPPLAGPATLPAARLRPLAAPIARAAAEYWRQRADLMAAPLAGLALWAWLAALLWVWLPAGHGRRGLALAMLVMALAAWLSSGALAPYAATQDRPPLTGPCCYPVNLDHQHFEAAFWMLDGDPAAKWSFSVVLRRIFFPLVAYPFMKALGFLEGGFLAALLVNLAALAAWGVFLRRRLAPPGPALGVWLLALYPGAAYWAGLPYAYAAIVPASLAGLMILTRQAELDDGWRAARWCLGLGLVGLAYDLTAYLAPAGLWLAWRAARRSGAGALQALGPAALGAGLIAAPLLAVYALLSLSPEPLAQQTTMQMAAIVKSYLDPSGWPRWPAMLARLPGDFAQIYLFSGHLALPLLFLALLALGWRRPGWGLAPAEAALLAAMLAVFLFTHLAPPYAGWQYRGPVYARFYQPAAVVAIAYAARVLARPGPRRGLMAAACALALCVNALASFGPALGLAWPLKLHWAFYRHGSPESFARNLAQLGRRPLGACPAAPPPAAGCVRPR